jgi:hypothetical protein
VPTQFIFRKTLQNSLLQTAQKRKGGGFRKKNRFLAKCPWGFPQIDLKAEWRGLRPER